MKMLKSFCTDCLTEILFYRSRSRSSRSRSRSSRSRSRSLRLVSFYQYMVLTLYISHMVEMLNFFKMLSIDQTLYVISDIVMIS